MDRVQRQESGASHASSAAEATPGRSSTSAMLRGLDYESGARALSPVQMDAGQDRDEADAGSLVERIVEKLLSQIGDSINVPEKNKLLRRLQKTPIAKKVANMTGGKAAEIAEALVLKDTGEGIAIVRRLAEFNAGWKKALKKPKIKRTSKKDSAKKADKE